jgi:hypothetical protein
MRALRAASILVASLVAAACAEDRYVYRPAEQATAQVSGLPAGRYAIPPERPLGTVLVASPGAVKMEFAGGIRQRMLNVRLVVANNADDTPWRIDTREQRVVVPGSGESRPAYANADGGLPPVVEILRGRKTTIDLYYPLPQDRQDPKHLPQFDVLWQVQTVERAVVERTPFERMEIEPEPYPSYYAGGYWPYWWYDPLWPGPSYIIAPGFVRPITPPVFVAPVPVHRP